MFGWLPPSRLRDYPIVESPWAGGDPDAARHRPGFEWGGDHVDDHVADGEPREGRRRARSGAAGRRQLFVGQGWPDITRL